MSIKLKFSPSNAKLKKLEKVTGKRVYSFSLLSGHSCPYAKECHSKAVERKDKSRYIQDGPHTKFRCFSASQEVLFPGLYNANKQNGRIVDLAGESLVKAVDAIIENLPKKAEIIRIHVGGDFKTQSYFDAWMEVAKQTKDMQFYAYTKSLPFWLARRRKLQWIDNLGLTASFGGFKDGLIKRRKLRYAKVVFSEQEAADLNLEIDHNDSHALPKSGKPFALLLHGIQPQGSEAAKALKALKGKGSYGKSST